ncbi:hypothetical protein EYC54_01585 [Xanthomonas oryzae]|nr:hypothetical protein EYC54_01585 [Xanthomonas oryzae]
MILSLADGATNSVVARRYRVSRPTVSLWRNVLAVLHRRGGVPDAPALRSEFADALAAAPG